MRACFDLLFNRQKFSVFADEKSPAPGESTAIIGDAEAACRVSCWVAEDGIVQVEFFCESGVIFSAVATRSEISDVVFAEGFTALTERFALGRSATGKRFRIPGNHDCLFSLEVR